MRLLTRCAPSLTSSHAPHPSALPARPSIARFRAPTLRAHGIRPARAHARHPLPLALSLCTAPCTQHLSFRFLAGLNESFSTRCGTRFGTQVSLLKSLKTKKKRHFLSAFSPLRGAKRCILKRSLGTPPAYPYPRTKPPARLYLRCDPWLSVSASLSSL